MEHELLDSIGRESHARDRSKYFVLQDLQPCWICYFSISNTPLTSGEYNYPTPISCFVYFNMYIHMSNGLCVPTQSLTLRSFQVSRYEMIVYRSRAKHLPPNVLPFLPLFSAGVDHQHQPPFSVEDLINR